VTKFGAELALDFGAFDVILEKYTNHLIVLEVNTAPGLSPKTLELYRNGLQNLVMKRNIP
jgi:D-alanine-D-alanine ligase-like ATP-grasp enzyme